MSRSELLLALGTAAAILFVVFGLPALLMASI